MTTDTTTNALSDDQLSRLWARHGATAHAALASLGLSPDAIEEGKQQTLIRIWKRAVLDLKRSPAAYIYTTALRIGLDMQRRKQREAHLRQKRGALATCGRGTAREEDECRRVRELIEEALCLLKRDHREVLELRHKNGLTDREIMTRLNITSFAVSKRIERATNNLRRIVTARLRA